MENDQTTVQAPSIQTSPPASNPLPPAPTPVAEPQGHGPMRYAAIFALIVVILVVIGGIGVYYYFGINKTPTVHNVQVYNPPASRPRLPCLPPIKLIPKM